MKQLGLLLGTVALSGLLVAGLALWEQGGQSAAPSLPAEPAPDKSSGLVNAPVVVIEYADFQCEQCQQFAAAGLTRLRENYVKTGQARLVFRHLAAGVAAEAAECANEQGHFWDYHDRLLSGTGENAGEFGAENLKRLAVELRLEAAQFNQCLDTGAYQSKIAQEIAAARQLGITQAPTFLVNGQAVPNGSDYPTLQAAIEAALRRPSEEFAPGLVGPGLGE